VFRWFYPYYHRRYIFVSLGGYWPVHYRYVRYYWYGCHPYAWYGYYPVAYEVGGDTYNYYTYNYCDGDVAVSGSCESISGLQPVDHTTFADVRERLAQEAAGEPEQETLADRFFEDAVEAFGAGDYDLAADRFSKAMELAPDDMVLPFAYAQALFAGQKYTEAAEVLRMALANVSPEKEGVFYPRGLYPDDEVLFKQIEQLAEHTELYGFDADLQLLLGYHLFGIGELDQAVEPLRLAAQDLENASSATVLLVLLEKSRTPITRTE
jgi:tetratricopeptide (TPR) repeat protein